MEKDLVRNSPALSFLSGTPKPYKAQEREVNPIKEKVPSKATGKAISKPKEVDAKLNADTGSENKLAPIIRDAKKEIKSHRFQIVLTETTYKMLKGYCINNRVSMNELINELIIREIGE